MWREASRTGRQRGCIAASRTRSCSAPRRWLLPCNGANVCAGMPRTHGQTAGDHARLAACRRSLAISGLDRVERPPLFVRCVEFHDYQTGAGLIDPGHIDVGSTITLSVQLSDPGPTSAAAASPQPMRADAQLHTSLRKATRSSSALRRCTTCRRCTTARATLSCSNCGRTQRIASIVTIEGFRSPCSRVRT